MIKYRCPKCDNSTDLTVTAHAAVRLRQGYRDDDDDDEVPTLHEEDTAYPDLEWGTEDDWEITCPCNYRGHHKEFERAASNPQGSTSDRLVPSDRYRDVTFLQKRYADGDVWGSHPYFGRGEWKEEVVAGDTNLGYWEWVIHRIEATFSEGE